ncbi:FAD-dependent oxidoreductase [Chelativorans sp. ZYF759]|uniref:oxidoreductase n=1 Tax=Chelativorans sp. ZYF759 TaxID=2692213 RepID=UPI00145F744F|nr:FAD-dependent oxidoreductase [Chelativorans sp. ZYF759]NMG41671.1 FAD-dependent oxidoreductase [Chelativorans sp. ZYF759]
MPYDLLASPFRLAGLEIPNRTVMSPMSSGLGNADGSVSPGQVAFYRERAEGGVGLVIVEFTCVNRRFGRAELNQLVLDGRDTLASHGRLAAAIRRAGSRVALQLHAAGRHVDRRTVDGLPGGPTAEVSKRDGVTPTARALTHGEIEEIIDSFGRAAALALEAGYEAIEIHGAHGYLPMAFLSPLANRRDDAWGGDFERRLRFAESVVRRVKNAIGPDRPLLYRLSSAEHLPGGLTVEDMERIAPRLVAAGADCLDVSTGTLAGSLDLAVDPMSMPEGWRFEDSRRIRAAAGAPVVGIGPVRWPGTAEDALARGDADLICLGRPLLADAAWVRKAIGGEENRIRACTNCNWCFTRVVEHQPIGCAESPRTGNELAPPLPESGQGRVAVVVGGGPGGMAAALDLDLSGYQVHLFEARERLGGGLTVSARPPLKEKLFWYRDYLEAEIARSGISIHLGHAADVQTLLACEPAVAVIATGAQPLGMEIEGADTATVINAYDLLAGDVFIDAEASLPVVVYGGGETGCETAEYLAAKGHSVVIVTRSDARQLARSAEAMYRKHLVKRLFANDQIIILDNAMIEALRGNVIIVRRRDGRNSRLDASALVIAQGRRTGAALAKPLEQAGVEVTVIGDANHIARIGDAVHSAHGAVRGFVGGNLLRSLT